MKNTTSLKIFLLISLLLKSTTLSALAITHVESIYKGYVYYEADIVIDYIDTTLDIPNPCYNPNPFRGCYMGTIMLLKGNTVPAYNAYKNTVRISQYRTFGEAAKAYIKEHPLPARLKDTVMPGYDKDPEICFGFGWDDYDSPNNGGVDQGLYPNLICRKRPPVTLDCQLSGPVNINYNTLLMTEVNNARKDAFVTLTCNMDAQVNVSAYGSSNIEDIQLKNDASLVAKITVNDKRGITGDTINVKSKLSTTIKVSSVLSQTAPIEPGPFHGSGVLQVSFE